MRIAQNLFDWIYEQTLPEKPIPPSSTLWIGHRGLMEHPSIKENTLEAFGEAIKRGAGVELDLRLSKCGALMVHHDRTAQRVFGMPFGIADLSRAEWNQVEPEIPTLDEVMDTYPDCPAWMIEVKDLGSPESNHQLIQTLAEFLANRTIQGRICLLALSAELLQLCREILPGLPRAYVYLVSPKLGLQYLDSDPECNLMGWHMSFPRAKIPASILQGNNWGVGFANYPWTAAKIAGQGYPLVFSDRLDRVLGTRKRDHPL